MVPKNFSTDPIETGERGEKEKKTFRNFTITKLLPSYTLADHIIICIGKRF